MPSTEERLTQLENSVLKLANNKLDVADLSAWTNGWNAQYIDLVTAVNSIKHRIDTLEERLVDLLSSS
jgi:hypothetical protein